MAIFSIASAILEGEIALQDGRMDEAVRRFQEALDLVIVDRRHDRRDQHRHRDALVGEPADGVEPARRARRARLHAPGEDRIERRQRHRDLGEAALRHRPEDVDVARDQGRFGDHADGVPEGGQHLQDRPGQPERALDFRNGDEELSQILHGSGGINARDDPGDTTLR